MTANEISVGSQARDLAGISSAALVDVDGLMRQEVFSLLPSWLFAASGQRHLFSGSVV
jgi:hypothetical protein